MSTTCLITGATGFVGGHLAEACVERGWSVRTVARANSKTELLDRIGVTVFRGDLTNPASIREAMDGVDVVVHTAAKVGDWGPVEEYRSVNVEGLRNLLDVCRGTSLQRFVHLSSLGVYPVRHHHGTDETTPLPEHHIDGYTQSKVESEKLALQYERDHGVPVVVLRPGFIYGPRDRTVLPQLVEKLRTKKVRYLGGGQRLMNTIYVGNLVEAIFLALGAPNAVGQVFNLTDGEAVSKRRFLEAIVDGLELPKIPPLPVPLFLAKLLAWQMEGAVRRRGDPQPPRLTQARVKFLGYNLDFSIDKAKQQLGYQPRYTFDQGMRATLDWLRGREPEPVVRELAG